MKKPLWVAIGLCIARIASGDAKLEEQRKTNEEDLASKLKGTNERCGTSIAATYDRKADPDKACSYQGCGYSTCVNVITGIGAACNDHKTTTKLIVADKMKHIACKFSAGSSKRQDKDEQGPELELKGDTLSVMFDWDTNAIGHERSYKLVENLTLVEYEAPRCKPLRDAVKSAKSPDDQRAAAKQAKKPAAMSDDDWTLCTAILERVIKKAESTRSRHGGSSSSSSSRSGEILKCKTGCNKQCRPRSPGDACMVSIHKCENACK